MGTDKSLIELDGVAMAERVATTLEAAGCDPVVFVGGDERALAVTGRRFVPDRWPGEGPVGGVVTALEAAVAVAGLQPGGVVVCACDLPDLTVDAVRAVIGADSDRSDVRVADTGRLEPMLACWSPATAGRLAALFTGGGIRALHQVIFLFHAVTVPVDPAALRNVNRPADLGKHQRPRLASLVAVAIAEIDIDEFADRLAEGVRVIDVREPDEYEAGHVPGAELIPLGTVAEHLDRFVADGTTYVICKSGGRSMRACELASSQGYDVVNVTGGTGAWMESGRDTIQGDSPS